MGAHARKIHVGLLWHSCESDNLGVGALTVANARLAADALAGTGVEPVFHIIGFRGGLDYASEIAADLDFTNVGFKGLLTPGSSLRHSLDRCDVFLDIGAGDSFSDLYGWRRYSLIAGLKLMAKGKAPLVLSPQTIGPFASSASRHLARNAMAVADLIFARDKLSHEMLKEMGFGDRAVLTTDVAFALPFEHPELPESVATRRTRVGLNVSALLYRRDLAHGDRISLSLDFVSLTERIIERLLACDRYDVHLIPHVIPRNIAYENDYAVAEGLKARYPALVLPERFRGPCEAKSYIAGCDLLIGSRMHATIAALSSDTAVLPLGYSRKFTGLFGSLGYDMLSDLTREDEHSVLAKLDQALGDLPALSKQARDANCRAQERLGRYRAALAEVLMRVCAE